MPTTLKIVLDDYDTPPKMATSPQFTAGSLLRGTVTLIDENEAYLNSIKVLLRWLIQSQQPRAIKVTNDLIVEQREPRLLVSGEWKTIGHWEISRIPHLAQLKTEVVDQRKIAKGTYTGFTNALSANTLYSWRFTLQIPRAPWSYPGLLFGIFWQVEAHAEFGRIRLPLIGTQAQAALPITVNPPVSQVGASPSAAT